MISRSNKRFVCRNCEDAYIPPKGVLSRICAHNLMVGDEFILNNNAKFGKVVSVRVDRMYRGQIEVTIRPNGSRKTFDREYYGYPGMSVPSSRVWIREYPHTRFARRALRRSRSAS